MAIRITALFLFAVLLAGCPPPPGVYHTVREGQTLYRIGKIYRVDDQLLLRYNGIEDPTRLQVGQKLFIPGVTRVREIPTTTSAVKSPSSAPLRRAENTKTSPGDAGRKTSPAKSPPPPPRAEEKGGAPAKKGTFDWPLKGKVVKKFTTRAKTPSRGIEIAAPKGSEVYSAAAGRVIYSGDGINGYGKLIIVKHDDSYFTVYGFNSQNLVETGNFVGKKQRIALSGTPPSGGAPRLHFEIRRGKQAVNPIFYLP